MKQYHRTFCVDQMAKVLGVSRSGYYEYLRRSKSPRACENEELLHHIYSIFKESEETYGSPRIHAELVEQGLKCSRPRVARLMKAHHIQAKMYKKFVKTTKRDILIAPPDLVQQQFQVNQPNSLWLADITYIRIHQQWAYLAVVLDVYARKIVGMALKDHMRAELILTALEQALIIRKPPQGLIHHSDLGSQYTCHGLQMLAKHHGIKLSYAKSAYDNAVMESFFHTLKTEHVYFKNYQSLEEAKLEIFTYIFSFYNSKRRHSTLNYQSPNSVEKQFNQQKFVSLQSV